MKSAIEARTRILDAAERLFAQHGFDATATSRIAKAAAVPKGLLFYYFPSKKDLLSCLVGERLVAGSIDAGPLIEPGNPVRALLNLSEKLLQVEAASDVIRIIVWREQHTHPEVKANLAEHVRALYRTIEQVLAGSLRVPVAASRLRTAAVAWAAIVTARPLAGTSVASLDDGVAVESPGKRARDTHVDLASMAELLCAGLVHGSALPA